MQFHLLCSSNYGLIKSNGIVNLLIKKRLNPGMELCLPRKLRVTCYNNSTMYTEIRKTLVPGSSDSYDPDIAEDCTHSRCSLHTPLSVVANHYFSISLFVILNTKLRSNSNAFILSYSFSMLICRSMIRYAVNG